MELHELPRAIEEAAAGYRQVAEQLGVEFVCIIIEPSGHKLYVSGRPTLMMAMHLSQRFRSSVTLEQDEAGNAYFQISVS